MAQGDYLIQNQSFPSFRSDLNETLEAINTSNSGTSRPTSAVAGTVWLDVTNATNPTLKFFDGTDDISLAQLDYSANTVNWLDSSVVADLVNDTTPQLGGDLDVNGNDIVSVSNGNITFTPDGTGKVIIDGLSFPTSDGSADQVLKTDGAGNLSFGDVSGGTSWQSSIKTSAFTAVAGEGYWINTTSGAVTMTLPASASVGDTVEIVDYARTWGTNAVTINQNSLNFQGYTSPNPVYDTNGQSVRFVYSGSTKGWIPTVDDDVTDEVPQPYSADILVVAGGGGGGDATISPAYSSGGGGAGGFRTSTSNLTIGATYTVTVGGGGSISSDGSNSSISGTGVSITSAGGGAGGDGGTNAGQNGGSGGGGGGSVTSGSYLGGSGNTPSTSPSQGNDGGDGDDTANTAGGGGGGASASGQNGGSSSDGGDGGNGSSSSITGSSVTYAGGGGGGSGLSGGDGSSVGIGGTGGGGPGGRFGTGTSGTVNTGGGGGGSRGSPSGDAGTSGGSGIVIIRVATADYSGTTTGSPTVSVDGTDTVIKFTGSGSYTA